MVRLSLVFKEYGAQWRQIKGEGIGPSMGGMLPGFHFPGILKIASPVCQVVAVEQLDPFSAGRHTNMVIIRGTGVKLQTTTQSDRLLFSLPDKAYHAVHRIIDVDPFKASSSNWHSYKAFSCLYISLSSDRWFFYALVVAIPEQVPLQAAFMVPFGILGKFTAHESSLPPGWANM
jgi:hypothetical protein